MVTRLDSFPQPGALGCRLPNSDGTLQTTSVQAFPTITNQILALEILKRVFRNASLWGMRPLFIQSDMPSEVEVISEACLLVSTKAFNRVGGFATDYFMYSDDVDLCLRLPKLGLKNYYLPSATVIRHGGGSSGQAGASSFSSLMLLESRWKFFSKHRSSTYSMLYRFGILFASLARIVTVAIVWPVGAILGHRRRFNQIIANWYRRLRWTLGLENWVRNSPEVPCPQSPYRFMPAHPLCRYSRRDAKRGPR